MAEPSLLGKRLFLLDMDGTIYLGEQLFDGTVDFLNYVNQIGGKYLFFTNNSSRSVDAYIEKMARLGIRTTADDFLTSVDALCVYLKHGYENKRLYAFGTASFRRQLAQAGFSVTDRLEDGIDALVCGFDTELTFQKLEDACILLNRGVDFIAANPDWVCPTWYGYVPDCGSVCQMLTRATGREPVFIGKPQPEMALLAMEKYGYEPRQTLMAGDRIYTDIACGIRAGVDTALLLSGESTLDDVRASAEKPTMIFENIRALLDELKRCEAMI
ncbi:MAG: HAD-IIA family hydrolase [Candidatus Faecousia sp.]|nr:HAD-IIA family hydrolase [Candidatus Faecousia sp.]